MRFRVEKLFIICNLYLLVICQGKICPNTWKKYKDSCYRLIKQSVSWSQAELTCRAWNHGHLVSISNLEEQDFVQSLVTEEGVRVPVWIGFRKNKYQWTDGTELHYEDWNSNQPRQYASTVAYSYLSKNARWKWFDVQYAAHEYTPLCKMSKSHGGGCPDASYWEWSDHCYRLQPVRMSFGQSETLCQRQGGNLASIHSEAEMTFLRAQLTRHANNNVWIGLMLAKKPFTFEWSDECTNGTSYSNWRSNVHDVSNVGSICARLDNTQRWRWSVLGCTRGNYFYLCESNPIEPMNQALCPSQTGNVTPRIIEPEFTESAQTETATIENSEHLDLISESQDGCVCGDLVIQLIGAILAAEGLLVILVLIAVCCIRKRCKQNKERNTSKPTVLYRKPSEPENPFVKLNNQMSYEHMNPTDEPPVLQNGIYPSVHKTALPNPPASLKANDYAEHKIPSYENEVNTKQDEHNPDDYQEIDEYEELPLNENVEGYELPAK